jgi:UDP-N-acetylmuramoylalanine--D-glutamate ligase
MLDLAGKKVTVMGLGRFGGGIGVTRWLVDQGADVLVTDLAPAAELEESIAAISGLTSNGRVGLRLGEHNVSDFTTCDLVVANPAVPKPWDNRFLRAASAASVAITTEIGLLVERLPERRRVIGVTGSVGKSTSTAMINHALARVAPAAGGSCGGRVFMGGNIGGSLLGQLPELDARSWIVLELSSAMLWWLGRGKARSQSDASGLDRDAVLRAENESASPDGSRGWSPGLGLVTNISENHLDWHGEFGHYRASKQVLIRSMDAEDAAVFVDASVRLWAERGVTRARAIVADTANWRWPMKLPGAHNAVNAIGALETCAAAIGEEHRETLAQAIADFGGLEHRLQLVCERRTTSGGTVRCYNDSKSTTPESCLKAIAAVASQLPAGERGVHLIAGGYDKKISLRSVADACAGLAGLYTIGATGRALARSARDAAGRNGAERIVECDTLGRAVSAALERAKPGEAVLLSPACASWDQYVNFEERGNEFVRLVSAGTGATK